MRNYNKEEDKQIKKLFSLPDTPERRKVIEKYGSTIGKSYNSLYQRKKYCDRKRQTIRRTKKDISVRNISTNNEIRISYVSVTPDLTTKELVFKLK